jgi:hypothetical protein
MPKKTTFYAPVKRIFFGQNGLLGTAGASLNALAIEVSFLWRWSEFRASRNHSQVLRGKNYQLEIWINRIVGCPTQLFRLPALSLVLLVFLPVSLPLTQALGVIFLTQIFTVCIWFDAST